MKKKGKKIQLSAFELHVNMYRNENKPGAGPMWTIEMVSETDMAKIAGQAFHKMTAMKDRDPYEVYAETLAYYGIICPHPQQKRLYGGDTRSPIPLYDPMYYDCEMCKCAVLNEQRMRKREQKEEADVGRDGTSDGRKTKS